MSGMTVDAFELYRSKLLLVRAVFGHGSDTCVVTFDSYSDKRTLERPGFAEGFLEQQGIDAIHVVASDNDWYLYPEMPAAMQAIAERVKPYARVLTYGSSMGGYAAIRFGRMAGASAAIAISPQFSLDPRVVPFEYRWPEYAYLDFGPEQSAQPFVDKSYIIYDSRNIDRRHVDLYRQHTEVIDIAIPYAGHPASGYLSQTGLLKSAILDAFDERLDISGLVREARQRRGQSADYFSTLTLLARNPHRRVSLSSKAAALSNGNPMFLGNHALYMGLAGRHEEARALFEPLLSSEDVLAPVLFNYSVFQEQTGDIAGAIGSLERLMAMEPAAKMFRARRDAFVAMQNAAPVLAQPPSQKPGWLRWPFKWPSRRRSSEA